jgi:transposase
MARPWSARCYGVARQREGSRQNSIGYEVASYFGLTPSPWWSGGIDRVQGTSKTGNPRARCAAVELSWLWLRHQPESALSQWFHHRTLNASKRFKRIAIVALARKLMVALWRYLATGLVPEGAVLKAVKA